MSSPLSPGFLITLCLLLSCRLVMGIDPSQATNPLYPAPNQSLLSPGSPLPGAIGPPDIGNSAATPAMLALPASTGPASGTAPFIDAGNFRKFYTITAELRETYDTNVNTATSGQGSYETSISPSILVDFPHDNWELSAGYTFGLTLYESPSSAGGANLQYSNLFIAQYRHDISERFSLSASDQLIDSPEPNIYGSTGTPYRDGQNISNSFTSGLSSQWTPLFGTQTTYANTLVRYLDSAVSTGQDSDENTASQSFSFSILPKISVNFGGVADTITYDDVNRGYTSLTAFVGSSWEALPTLSVSVRGGGSYTTTQQSANFGPDSFSPYADLSANWQLGERSSLSGDYSHEITPTDQTGANGQESDRFSAVFNYNITPRLSANFKGIYTYSEISGSLINSAALSSYSESDYGLDTGMSYNFDKYFSTNFDISVSGVSSQIAARDYARQELSVGVRGTY